MFRPEEKQVKVRMDLALEIAQEAGDITLEYFQKNNYTVEQKYDCTPVTVADKRAEEHMRQRIKEMFPEDAVLGEEYPEMLGTSGFRWILDPIDGTKSFIHGVPLYGTLIGVEYYHPEENSQSTSEGLTERRGVPECILGVIRIPALDEMVYARLGGGAWYVKGDAVSVPAHVSFREKLSEAVTLTSEEKTFYDTHRDSGWKKLVLSSQLARSWGDCYGYLLVATGRADVMVDPEMSLWDAAALYPIILEAGGTFTDWNGIRTYRSGDGVASNGILHAEVMALLK